MLTVAAWLVKDQHDAAAAASNVARKHTNRHERFSSVGMTVNPTSLQSVALRTLHSNAYASQMANGLLTAVRSQLMRESFLWMLIVGLSGTATPAGLESMLFE